MSDPRLRLAAPEPAIEIPEGAGHGERRLGRILYDRGLISATDAMAAQGLQKSRNARFGELLVAEGLVSEGDVVEALAEQFHAQHVSLAHTPPDPVAIGKLSARFCLENGVCAWSSVGGMTFIATANPTDFERVRARLPEHVHPVAMAVASRADIEAVQQKYFAAALVEQAQSSVQEAESCRPMGARRRHVQWAGLATLLGGVSYAQPQAVLAALSLMSIAVLALSVLKKVLGLLGRVAPGGAGRARGQEGAVEGPLPRVSILVPMFREKEIILTLIARLEKLRYPRALLEVVLVLEAEDHQTRGRLAGVELPAWMRVIEVPRGAVRTKPRAMNYALQFCSGDIIGIYDAEDAPEPEQIMMVARHFAAAPEEVGCVQAVLDYYNARSSWMARCFAIEYAAWFRVLLPGLARLGFAIPLGGTSVFFRRHVLDRVGAWDAHNVTEDADLGIRLARYGYRTEMIGSVTNEEATHKPLAWVRQRSRWLKGFMLTYLVHMRHPLATARQLGPWRFFGFNLMFLTSFSHFLLAPVLWSFWLLMLGLGHPVETVVTSQHMQWLLGLFFMAELLNITIGLFAVSRPGHRYLMKWVPTQMLYFSLGTLAALKAAVEVVVSPFYWDKTSHGHSLRPARRKRLSARPTPVPALRPAGTREVKWRSLGSFHSYG